MERILFRIKFPAEIWKIIKYEIKEIFQKYFGAKLLNQIDNVVIIQNKVWYQLTYRLFQTWNCSILLQCTDFSSPILYFSGACLAALLV